MNLEFPVQPSLKTCIKIIAGALLFSFVWILITTPILIHYGFVSWELLNSGAKRMSGFFDHLPGGMWILMFTKFAFIEEFIYRLIPLAVALLVFGWSRYTRPMIWVVAIAESVVFGLDHGYGLFSLVNQGVLGFVWSFVFLKASGFNVFHSFQGFLVSGTVHSIWNVGLTALIKMGVIF